MDDDRSRQLQDILKRKGYHRKNRQSEGCNLFRRSHPFSHSAVTVSQSVGHAVVDTTAVNS